MIDSVKVTTKLQMEYGACVMPPNEIRLELFRGQYDQKQLGAKQHKLIYQT